MVKGSETYRYCCTHVLHACRFPGTYQGLQADYFASGKASCHCNPRSLMQSEQLRAIDSKCIIYSYTSCGIILHYLLCTYHSLWFQASFHFIWEVAHWARLIFKLRSLHRLKPRLNHELGLIINFSLPHSVAFLFCNSSILQYSGVSRNSAVVYIVCASSAIPCLGVLGWL